MEKLRNLDFSGTVFGEVSLGQDLNTDDFSLDITLKNGELANQPFDEFYISSLYKEGILHLEELTLTDGNKTGFQVMGTFPILADSTQPTQIDFKSSFKNIDMTILTQFHQSGSICYLVILLEILIWVVQPRKHDLIWMEK